MIVAAYVPLYWWRKITDKRRGIVDSDEMPLVVGSPGGVDFGGMQGPTVVTPESVPTLSTMQAETEL